MPPGASCPKPPVKVVERQTAEVCLAIARRVGQRHREGGDAQGSQAADEIIRAIQAELLVRQG